MNPGTAQDSDTGLFSTQGCGTFLPPPHAQHISIAVNADVSSRELHSPIFNAVQCRPARSTAPSDVSTHDVRDVGTLVAGALVVGGGDVGAVVVWGRGRKAALSAATFPWHVLSVTSMLK